MKTFAVKERRATLATRGRQRPVPRPYSPALQRILHGPRVQTKLKVGAPDDAYEREADRVADQVMRMPEPEALRPRPAEEPEEEEETLRRQAPEREQPDEELAAELARAPEDQLRRQPAETAQPGEEGSEPVGEEEPAPWPELEEGELEALTKFQAKAVIGTDSPVPDAAVAGRVRAPSSGRPLPADLRGFMEPRFEADFSGVRLHDSSDDRADARRLRARAFTFGAHVWLGPGESAGNRRLMAHELTHVVQQRPEVRHKTLPPPSSVRGPALSPAPRRIQRLSSVIGEKLNEYAQDIPGYTLITVLLGKNPLTGKPVARNAVNLVGGFLGLIPGGNRLFKNLKDSGALGSAFTWLREQVAALNISLSGIMALVDEAWERVSIWEGVTENLRRVKAVFAPTVNRVIRFAKAVGKKVLDFIFEGGLRLAGPLAERVLKAVRKAGTAFSSIIDDPIGFVRNLVRAVVTGFRQFGANIWAHLISGLMGWLFGALKGAGLELPEKFDLRGIVSIVLQVLGLTYARLRTRLVKTMGEKRVAYLETALEFLKVLVTEGLIGAWRKILEYVGSLKDIVIGKIREWVASKIVTAAITKLVSMFNPAGAVIQAILAIYNTVVFFIERFNQIVALAQSVLDSIANIAAGRVEAAANSVEQTMARTLPVIISFLARLIGLGGISGKIKDIIKGLRAKVDKAVTKLINFIATKAKKLFAKLTGRGETVGRKVSHQDIVKEVKTKLSAPARAAEPAQAIAEKKQQAMALKVQYQPLLEPGLKITITLDEKVEGVKADADIDFKIRIGPNDTETTGESPVGAGIPDSEIAYDPPVAGGGKKVEAKVLTESSTKETGSEPSASVSPGKWAIVKDAMRLDSSGKPVRVYIRGHLLNHHLHGTGKEAKNLAPITRIYNADMSAKFEEKAKDVFDKNKANPKAALYFKTEVAYGSHANRSSPPAHATPNEKGLYEAETGLPSVYNMHFHRIEKKNGKWQATGAAGDYSKMHDLPHQTFYGDKVPVLEIDFNDKGLGESEYKRRIKYVSLIDDARAGAIWAALDTGGTFASLENLKRVSGVGDAVIAAIKADDRVTAPPK